jgi:hypothetical protein
MYYWKFNLVGTVPYNISPNQYEYFNFTLLKKSLSKFTKWSEFRKVLRYPIGPMDLNH